MAQDSPLFFAFNHGEVSKSALGRIDQQHLRLAAEEQINWQPSVLGPMSLRGGLGYLGSTASDAAAKMVPFVFGVADTALIELTDQLLRVWVSDTLLTTTSVSTSVTNGDFNSSAGWTLSMSPTGTGGEVLASVTGGQLVLYSRVRGGEAYGERSVAVAGGDINVAHRVRIEVSRGPVTFQIGSATGGDNYFSRTVLGSGTHSIVFTPTATPFYVRLSTTTEITKTVDSIQIEAAGTFSLPTPWLAANLEDIRGVQSGDIVYCACDGFQPRQIERRDNGSWSICLYEPTGGPYQSQPKWAENIIMDPSQGTGGSRTLGSSSSFFSSDYVNSLIAVDTTGQSFAQCVGGDDQFTDAVRVDGVSTEDRGLHYDIAGTWVGTITLQRSVTGEDNGFVDVSTTSSNVNTVYDDSADYANVTAWYRFGFKQGDYTSGFSTITMINGNSGGRGQGRIVAYSSPASVTVEIFDKFESANGGKIWRVGDWSSVVGWPSSVGIHDGRLFWGGRDKIWGSVSDDYTNFDELFVGDAGPLNRSFGFGPFANVNWILSLSRLIVGRDASVVSIRSSSFDAPLTPTAFTMRDCSSHGTAALQALKIDDGGVYVDKSGRRVYALQFDGSKGDYSDRDLTRLNIDIGTQGFVDMAVQRQPDTRVHFVRGDGLAAVLVYDTADEVVAWYRVQTDGDIENVVVLPGNQEDAVYYVVKRTINGSTKRYLERFALQTDCVGGVLNHQADAYVVWTGASSTTITGLSHLEAEEVVVWANGKDLGTYTVSGGQITISEAATSAVVGLGYSATYQSAKLAYAAQIGSALNQKKKIDHVGLVLLNTHYQGLEYGPDFTNMDNLPLVEEGAVTAADTIWTEYDADMMEFMGEWRSDSRLCLRATAPRPATVMAATFGITTHGKN